MKINRMMLLATAASIVAPAFDNGCGWKTDADGKIETDSSGNPLYVDDDGNATPVKYETAIQLRGEAKSHRERAERAEAELKKFDGLDPEAARNAIKATKDIDLSKMIDKGELDKVRSQMQEQFADDLKKRDEDASSLAAENRKLRLDNAFGSSEFLRDRVALPQDAVRATYEGRFDVKDGKVVALTPDGNVLLNKRGDPTTVDEAFELMIGERSDKDSWLKAVDTGGTGSQGAGGNRGTGNKMTRAQYDALGDGDRAAIGMKAAKGEIQIVD